MPEADNAVAADERREHDEVKVAHRWRNLLTMTGILVVDNTEGSVTSTIFPAIANALRLDSGHLGIISAVGKVIAVPTGPAWVWVSERIGRRATLFVTSLLGGIFGVLAGFSTGFPMLLIFTALMSAAVIGASPIANAVIADSFGDRERGKASGILYGAINSIAALVGPAIAQFTGLTNGWRLAMWTIGLLCGATGLVVLWLFKDPGVGAAESQLADLAEEDRVKKASVADVLKLFTIPSYTVMMISRLLSGHLLITIFGIQFLVIERGFTNPVASLVMVPFGVLYLVGCVGGGYLLPMVDKVLPVHGRIAVLQLAQVIFAGGAFFATQLNHGSNITIYAVFWGLMGFAQGLNPPVNRPIVSAVVLPELRGQAFAIWLTGFETVAWALFALVAGHFADVYSIQSVFLWIMVVLLLVNALFLSILHVTYRKDVRAVEDELDRRRRMALR